MRMFTALFLVALVAAGGYGTLLLFSRLTGVNMQQAICWGFRARHLELVLPWCIVYVIAFVMVMALLHKPYSLWNLNRSHTAALQGYAISHEDAKLYDPVEKRYAEYKMNSPLPAAVRFSETFNLLVLYKPAASGTYQNAQGESLWVSCIIIFFAFGGLILLYVITYGIAGLYIEKTGLSQTLSHRLVLNNFSQLTGYPFLAVLALFSLFVLVSAVAGGSLVNRITGEYEERFADQQEDLRHEILSRVAPGTVLKGLVVNRLRDYHKIYGRRDLPPPDNEDRTVDMATYTIEFRGLARHVPVYLSIVYIGDPDAIPQRKLLDRMFVPGKAGLFDTKSEREPREKRELDFLVNEDYSVTLQEQ